MTNGFNVKDELKELSVEELKELSSTDRLNFSILFLNIEKNINVGNLIRSAHLLGASKVFIIGSTRYDIRGTVGCHNYIDVERISCDKDDESLISVINSIKEDNNFHVCFLEQSDKSFDISSEKFSNIVKSNHCCFVIGNESDGISNEIIDNCSDSIIEISQLGVCRSLNAAVAGSILMFKAKEILEEVNDQ